MFTRFVFRALAKTKATASMLVMVAMMVTICILQCSAVSKTKVTYWYQGPGVWTEGIEWAIQEFNRSQTEIEVVGKPVTLDLLNPDVPQLQVAIAGNAGPDATFFERSFVGIWAEKGLLLPMDPYLSEDERTGGDFFRAPWSEVIWKGKVYALPLSTDVRGLLYNRDLFEAAGLPDRAPRSLKELDEWSWKLTKVDASGKIQQVGFIPWWGNWFFPGWSWAFGGKLVEGTRPTVDTLENLRALEWIVSYATKYGSEAIAAFPTPAFYQGKVGMQAQDFTYMGSVIKQYAPDLKYGAGEVPWIEGGSNGTWGGGFCSILPAGSKHPREAMAFLRFLARPDIQLGAIYRKVGALPVVAKAIPLMKEYVTPQEIVFKTVSVGNFQSRTHLVNFISKLFHPTWKIIQL